LSSCTAVENVHHFPDPPAKGNDLHRFGFIIHPLDARRDVARRYPAARYLPTSVVEWLLTKKAPMVLSQVRGVRSLTGAETAGWLIGCPLTPRQMLRLPTELVYRRIVEAGRIAQDQGADIVGLGAFTAVVGDGGVTIADRLDIAVTTGNSYTVAAAIEGAIEAARLMDIDPGSAHAAVVGAGGSIGRTSAIILAETVREITLVGLTLEEIAPVAEEIRAGGGCPVSCSDKVAAALGDADLVITVTSAADAIIMPEHLKPGAVVCDVARPRDVSVRVAKERDDVLVIEGGVIEVPGKVEFGFDFGFPPKMAYACMSETMMLALEGRAEDYTIGKQVSVAQAREMKALAAKHGFRLAGFRSFEKEVTAEQIEQVRRAAGKQRSPAARV
jgi:fatty aldehyde-generating acyl-ACP reductase